MASKEFTLSQKKEIIRGYERSADYQAQPKILSELNDCHISRIYSVLEEVGYYHDDVLSPPDPGKSRTGLLAEIVEPSTITVPDGLISKNKSKSHRVKWTPSKIDELYELRDSGKTTQETADELGVPFSTVRSALHRFKAQYKQNQKKSNTDSSQKPIQKAHNSNTDINESVQELDIDLLKKQIKEFEKTFFNYLGSLGLSVEDGNIYPLRCDDIKCSLSQGVLLGMMVSQLSIIDEELNTNVG